MDKGKVLWEWAKLPQEVQDTLARIFEEAKGDPDEAVRIALVGDCPNCGSRKTADGGDLGFYDDTTVGLCMECGYRWCLECGHPLPTWPCPHWDEWSTYCEEHGIDEEDDEALQAWLESCR